MAITGVNLRNSAGFVTDPTGFDVCLSANLAYTSQQGFGWRAFDANNGLIATRDRNSAYGANIAGMHFGAYSGSAFRLDLPNGPGTYKVYGVHADLGYLQPTGWRYKDGSTVIASVSGSVNASATYRNILDDALTPSNFNLSSEKWIAHTFTSDHLMVERDTSLASGNGVLSSVWVEPYTPPTGLGDEKLWLCPSLDDSPDDISGNNHHGTYNGGMSTVSDANNGGVRAYSFDGSNDYISLGDVCNFTNGIAISAWVKPDVISGNQTIAQKQFTSSIEAYNSRVSSVGELNFFSYSSSGGSGSNGIFGQTTNDITAGSWFHTLCSYDGTKWETFVNGTKISESIDSQGPRQNPSDLSIGASKHGTSYLQFFDGLIDDIRIFDRALSDREITHLATSRGIEENPYQFNGLGDEELWLCPTLNDSADDLSGNGNHGTYNGGMGTVADTSNGGTRAYSFDGLDDYINTGNSVSPTSGISMCAWVSLDSLPSGSTIRTVIEKGYDGSKEPFVFTFASGNLMAYTFNGAVHGTSVSYSSLSASTWYHIASTFDGSTWKIYIDGTLSASTNDSTALQTNTQNVLVGAATILGSVQRFFDGLMDDIRIFDRALTTSEITALASKRGYRNLTGPHPHPLTVAIEHPLG